MVVVQVPPTAYALCGNHFRDLRRPPRHRADAVAGKTSTRDGLASMAGRAGHPATRSSTTSTASCERRRVPKRHLPGDHGQVAPLLREQRDAGVVLVLVLLALFGVPRTFDVRWSRRWRAGGMRRLELTPSTPRRQALWALVRLLIANIVAFQRPVYVETPSSRDAERRRRWESSPSSSRPSAGRE